MNERHVFVAHGDITQLSVDAVAYSTSVSVFERWHGDLFSAFERNISEFKTKFYQARKARAEKRKRFEFGESFWIPLTESDWRPTEGDHGHRPYGLVVVAAGGWTAREEPHVGDAVKQAIAAAANGLESLFPQDAFPDKRFVIALPAFRLGKGGSRHNPLSSAREQIQAAASALTDWPRLDVVFMLYTHDLYQIFLEARQHCVANRHEEPGGTPVPSALADAIRCRESVFFIGAGLSVPAGVPSYAALMERIASELGEKLDAHDVGSYMDLAQWYREQHPKKLPQLIQEIFQVDPLKVKPTLAHYLLLALPVTYTITTNYDDLVERTLNALRCFPIKVVQNEDVARTGVRDETYVVKFHGDAHTLGTDVVLSRDDYDNFFVERPVMASLLEGLLLNQTFFFVGYSLRDPNFRFILSRIHQMLSDAKRDAYIITFESVNQRYREQCRSKRLHLIEIGGNTTAEQGLNFLRFLSELSAKVVGEKKPFLARDTSEWLVGKETAEAVQTSKPAPSSSITASKQPVSICDALWKIGEHIESTHERTSPDEAREMAKMLTFLTENGWRPTGSTRLSRIWEHLASRLGDSGTMAEEKRGMLIAALARTETFKDAERLRKVLENGMVSRGGNLDTGDAVVDS